MRSPADARPCRYCTAHPSSLSLNAALTDVTLSSLPERGYVVARSDLYGMDWDPVVRLSDFGAAADPRRPIGDQSADAYARGSLSDVIVAEQEKLRQSSLLILHFPLWLYGTPAILKGWFDRVFTKGFAFGIKDEGGRTRKYGDGGLAGKRALAVITAGDRKTSYDLRGLNGNAGALFFPFLHGIFWYTGIQPLRPHLVAGTDRPGWDCIEEESGLLRRRLADIATEAPISYRALSEGDYGPDRRLRPHIRPGETRLDIHLRDDGHGSRSNTHEPP